MTFLPIVERELREAARRRSSFRIRMIVALLTSLAAGAVLLLSYGTSPARLGKGVFATLASLAFAYCLVEGARNAADSVSGEKREGTLGLLFLTDLRGYDIILGKLAAVSVRSFQGLFAFVPVLAMTLILGGVTAGEFWRMTLILLNTLFFSMCVGLAVSCLSREAHKALSATLALLVFCTIVPLVSRKLFSQGFGILVGSFSPAFAAINSADLSYAFHWREFWSGLAVTHLSGWSLLVAASIAAARLWQDPPSSRWPWARFGPWSWLGPIRPRTSRSALLDQNPFFWLAARHERERRFLWLMLIASCGTWLVIAWANSANAGAVAVASGMVVAFLSVGLRVWVALQATRHLAEARRNQSLELFLVTPCRTDEMVTGQWLAAKHLFVLPVLVLVAARIFALVLQISAGAGVISVFPSVPMVIYQILRFVLDLLAIWWVGLWMGLRQKNVNHAFASTLLVAMVIPELLFCIPNVFIDLGLINWAKTKLAREFRKTASEPAGVTERGIAKRVPVRASPSAAPPVIAR